MSRSAPRSGLVLLALAIASTAFIACSAGTEPTVPVLPLGPNLDPPEPPAGPITPGAAATLSVLAGGNQTGTVGVELPQAIVARVVDANLLAVPNQIVSFVVVEGGGSVFAGTAQANALGEVRERWRLGTAAGPQVLEARGVDQVTGAPIVFSRIHATATPGPVATLTAPMSPENFTISRMRVFLGETVDARMFVAGARDTYGNAVADPQLAVASDRAWGVTGSIVAPTDEGLAGVTITAGSASLVAQIAAVTDLRPGRWTLSYHCGGQGGRGLSPINNMPVDSLEYAGVVDSIVYDDAIGSIDMRSRSHVWSTGTATMVGMNGEIETMTDHIIATELPVVPEQISSSPTAYDLGLNCATDVRRYPIILEAM